MAVAVGGFFGEYYSHYSNLSDSRNWNTKNYDYAVIKNKGSISDEAKNESAGSLQGTGLTVATNKNGYLATTAGEFIPELKNPIYQVRDRNGNVNNDYYVDQETGNVYFRPLLTGASISLPKFNAVSGTTNSFTAPAAFQHLLQVGGFVSVNGTTVQLATVVGPTATFSTTLPAAIGAGTQIDLIPVNNITPQYFGSSIELTRAPNPEDFGTVILGINDSPADMSAKQNIDYSFTAPAGNAYSELEVNGVKVAVNGLNTNIQSIPQFMLDNVTPVPPANSPLAPLFRYNNSFSTDANEFTSVEPPSKWKGTGVINGWLNNFNGPQTLPGGVPTPSTGFTDTGNFKDYESMWYPDTTDLDYSNDGLSDTELATKDVLFRSKFNLTSLPAVTDQINMFWGHLNNSANLYVNGHEVSFLGLNASGTTVNLRDFLRIGENVIAIRSDAEADGEEGVFVRMAENATSALGIDLNSTTKSWETRILTEPFDQYTAFTDPWTYDAPRAPVPNSGGPWSIDNPNPDFLENNSNGRYTTTTLEPGVFKKSILNTRTVDNYVASVSVALLDPPVAGALATDWFGFQLRTNDASDKPEESGYTIKIFTNGRVELHKALKTPITPPGTVANPTLVAISPVALPVVINSPDNVNQPLNLRIHANGSNIKLYNNNAEILNWVDTDANRYSDGYFSFSSQGLYVAYDDFKLSSYATPIQLLSKALQDGDNSLVVKGIAQNSGDMTFNGNIQSVVRDDNNLVIASGLKNINMSSTNIPPDLSLLTGGTATTLGSSKSIMDVSYRGSFLPNLQATELDTTKGYWSVSTQSALGIAGQIDFKNREGGSVQKVRDQFSGVNNLMQNLTSLLGSSDDLFESHLNLIR
jgi:hypothetical protein